MYVHFNAIVLPLRHVLFISVAVHSQEFYQSSEPGICDLRWVYTHTVEKQIMKILCKVYSVICWLGNGNDGMTTHSAVLTITRLQQLRACCCTFVTKAITRADEVPVTAEWTVQMNDYDTLFYPSSNNSLNFLLISMGADTS